MINIIMYYVIAKRLSARQLILQCGLKSQLAYVYIYICMCATSVTLRNAIDSLLTPRKCMRTTGPPGCIAPSTMLFVRSVNVCARPARPKSLLKITIRQDVRQCRKSGRSSETASPQAQTAPERKSYPGHTTIGIGRRPRRTPSE